MALLPIDASAEKLPALRGAGDLDAVRGVKPCMDELSDRAVMPQVRFPLFVCYYHIE